MAAAAGEVVDARKIKEESLQSEEMGQIRFTAEVLDRLALSALQIDEVPCGGWYFIKKGSDYFFREKPNNLGERRDTRSFPGAIWQIRLEGDGRPLCLFAQACGRRRYIGTFNQFAQFPEREFGMDQFDRIYVPMAFERE